jgi:drug/metabolite transporter (DMT)-like permease
MTTDTTSISLKTFKIIAIFLLILTTLLWGTSFIITKNLTREIPIFLYLGLRFFIAVLGFTPFFLKIKEMNKKIIVWGFLTGLIYYIAIAFQTVGIQTTTAGKAAFITGLSTVMVPFIVWFGFKKPINKRVWLAVIISVIGMAFLLLEGETKILLGDFLVLICAFLFAIFIILNDKYVHLVDVYLYSLMQLIVICIFCFGSSFMIQESYKIRSMGFSFWAIMIYMGLVVTTGTFIFQNWSQQYQDPAQTAIIFALEPVFAVLFASFILGSETMTFFGWIGCGLIFIAILIVVLKSKENNNNNKKD